MSYSEQCFPAPEQYETSSHSLFGMSARKTVAIAAGATILLSGCGFAGGGDHKKQSQPSTQTETTQPGMIRGNQIDLDTVADEFGGLPPPVKAQEDQVASLTFVKKINLGGGVYDNQVVSGGTGFFLPTGEVMTAGHVVNGDGNEAAPDCGNLQVSEAAVQVNGGTYAATTVSAGRAYSPFRPEGDYTHQTDLGIITPNHQGGYRGIPLASVAPSPGSRLYGLTEQRDHGKWLQRPDSQNKNERLPGIVGTVDLGPNINKPNEHIVLNGLVKLQGDNRSLVPGSSGSAMVDEHGRVQGVFTAGGDITVERLRTDFGINVQIKNAIPAPTGEQSDALVPYGKVQLIDRSSVNTLRSGLSTAPPCQ